MASSNIDYYAPGELIYASEPFAHVVYYKRRKEFCDYCLKSNSVMKSCAQCKYVFYCDRKCQEAAWADHKLECKRLNTLEDVNRDFNRLAGKVILKLKVKGQDYSETIDTYKRSFEDLTSHVDDVKRVPNGERDLKNLAVMLADYVGLENVGSIENAMEAVGKVRYNRHAIDKEREVENVGSGFYLGACIFHHSCIPNAVRTFVGSRIEVRAIKPIPKGDMKKVTISYFPTLGNSIQRKKVMGYFFRKCHCVDCSQPYGESVLTKIIDRERSREVIKFSEQLIYWLDKIEEEGPVERELINFVDCCLEQQRGVLGDTNLLRLKMFDRKAFLDSSVDTRKRYGRILLKNTRLAFGEATSEAHIILELILESCVATLDLDGAAECMEQIHELSRIHGTECVARFQVS